MSPEFCTDLTWIEDHIREALPGARCEVSGSEGMVVQAEGTWPNLAGIRLIGDGFELGETVLVRYVTGAAKCGFYSKVLASTPGVMLLESPHQILLTRTRPLPSSF